ncbi:MAG: FxsA family protein [Gammaproteobacteria bacterium]
MSPFPVLFLLFLLVPLVELWFLIKVGGWIGALPTVALTVMTAVIGASLARLQGLKTLLRMRQTMARGETPAIEVIEGVMLLAAALLLLTPGFFTDALGFAFLLPAIRRPLAWWALQRMAVVTPTGGPTGAAGQHQPRTLEGEVHREDDK